MTETHPARTARNDAASSLSPDVTACRSRRHLLGAAAGGFALATTGLLLPEWLVEGVEAANHPVRRVQHRKEQRRRKRRNEQQRNNDRPEREQSSEKDKLRRPDLYGFAGIQFNVYLTGTRNMNIQFFQLTTGNDKFPWVHKEGGDVHYPPAKTYQSTKFPLIDMPDCFLWIEEKVIIHAENPCCTYPLVTLGYGGRVDREYLPNTDYRTAGWKDGTTVVREKASPVGAASEMQTDLAYVRVQRHDDADGYIVFQVDLM